MWQSRPHHETIPSSAPSSTPPIPSVQQPLNKAIIRDNVIETREAKNTDATPKVPAAQCWERAILSIPAAIAPAVGSTEGEILGGQVSGTSAKTTMAQDESDNFALFRDSLSAALLRPAEPPAPEPKRRTRKRAKSGAAAAAATPADATLPATTHDSQGQGDAEDLSEFIDYLASEIFDSLPGGLQDLDHRSWRESEDLQQDFALPLLPDNLTSLNLPVTVADSLRTYNLISPDPTLDSPLPSTPEAFLVPVLTDYITTLSTPPPASYATRADACEICGRGWINLSYHHLIPRFVHDKAVKRGWHRKEDLQNVAWLCGACHRFVHHFKNHEELAREYYTVELLLEEEEVRRFAAWAGKLRWKGGNVRRR